MIYGIGTDIVDVKRIEKLYKKYGQTFAERILSPLEMHDWPGIGRPVKVLAKRFAAKEAFAKAVGTGIRAPVTFHAISVGHDEWGKPEFICAPELQKWLDKKGIKHVHLSMSDEEDTVVAFVVAEAA
ncbi:MAG TPA: holo-ACP synthase [Neisseria sp.]|jgi:holo-[acyl-carrier protein] synthase|uniref:holo-ACP synthase n=1 Tax=Uruburuella suis TaxID=252130 RepID=UPI001B64E2BC|nr:holo-ACP synthase [Neisseria sp.]MBP8045383.1 holo-ACP synthase [Neisseria sp.]MBP8069660.1 holo-ACP synthase [Neisseria sp.]MBP8874997.1 holo-ACP synthase [Neisseria sp.]HRM22353.1 holo-ACP synthase [Neisseria sp.]